MGLRGWKGHPISNRDELDKDMVDPAQLLGSETRFSQNLVFEILEWPGEWLRKDANLRFLIVAQFGNRIRCWSSEGYSCLDSFYHKLDCCLVWGDKKVAPFPSRGVVILSENLEKVNQKDKLTYSVGLRTFTFVLTKPAPTDRNLRDHLALIEYVSTSSTPSTPFTPFSPFSPSHPLPSTFFTTIWESNSEI